MERRDFLGAAAAVVAGGGLGAAGAQERREQTYYQLRRYSLRSGPQVALTEKYFAEALLPALNRMGVMPVGAMKLDIGPETPAYYLVMPATNLETLVNVDLRLAEDAAFMKAAEPWWSAGAAQPSFLRVESTLLGAFHGWPKPTPPKGGKRIFQLRTYESPSYKDHALKVAMFHDGEFELFAKAGMGQVFYGDALVGPRLPSLTYMLTFPDYAALEVAWEKFRTDPDWQKLSRGPKYGSEAIVSNVTNLILSPLACSQI